MAVAPTGQQKEKPYTTTYMYDLNNRLLTETKVQQDETETLRYAYDANGAQVYRERETVTKHNGRGTAGAIRFVQNLEKKDRTVLDTRTYNGQGFLAQPKMPPLRAAT